MNVPEIRAASSMNQLKPRVRGDARPDDWTSANRRVDWPQLTLARIIPLFPLRSILTEKSDFCNYFGTAAAFWLAQIIAVQALDNPAISATVEHNCRIALRNCNEIGLPADRGLQR